MAKKKTPSFVLTMEMMMKKKMSSQQIVNTIQDESGINRQLYNACLGELLKREKQMVRTKRYKKIKRQLLAISRQISFYESRKVKTKPLKKETKEKLTHYQTEKEQVMEQLFDLQAEFGLFEYSMHEYIKPMREHFHNKININIAQKTATRAWNTFNKKLKGGAKKVRFIPKGEFVSFEGKNNTTGWRFIDRQIVYKEDKIDLHVKENDLWMEEALSSIENNDTFTYKNSKGEEKTDVYKVKFVRIIEKDIRGKKRYFAQLICQGYPPVKKDKNGKEKYPLGKGRVGGDIGTSTMSFVSEKKVTLFNLAEQIKRIDDVQRDIRLLQRKMDRSRRASNLDNYDEQGRIKKGKKEWHYSKRYRKTKNKLKELHRKLALYRKYSHQYMANRIKMWGHEFYIEKMMIRGLQKRAKETKISEKTGKYQKKKRFGKTIAHRAPSLFIQLLKQKVLASGGTFEEVDTFSFKASQYDHLSGTYKKKELKDRWHEFEDQTKVQRDLYSAFLLKNSQKNKKKTNRTLCLDTYETFKQLHDEEVKRLETLDALTLNSGIRLKNKKKSSIA